MAIIIEQSIVKAMQVEWSEVKHRQLAKILGTGMELFRLLQQQQALFFIQMPLVSIDGQAQDIQPEWEEDVDGLEDEETLAGRLIEISVFPGFYKSCDERGESVSRAQDKFDGPMAYADYFSLTVQRAHGGIQSTRGARRKSR